MAAKQYFVELNEEDETSETPTRGELELAEQLGQQALTFLVAQRRVAFERGKVFGIELCRPDAERLRAVVAAVLARANSLSACPIGCAWDEYPRMHRDDCLLVVNGFADAIVDTELPR